MVTTDLFEFTAGHVPGFYYDEEKEKLAESVEVVLEDVWLEAVYGSHQGKLTNEAWVEKVTSLEGKIIFDATAFRAQIFTTAGVGQRHIKKRSAFQKKQASESLVTPANV